MSRNFGVTGPTTSRGFGQSSGLHISAGAGAESNLLADHSPPGRLHLAVVRDSSFLQKHELNPVERLDAELDHREFAACVFWAVFITIVFGAPIAAATAFMSWS